MRKRIDSEKVEATSGESTVNFNDRKDDPRAPLQPGELAPDLSLLDHVGQAILLSSLWQSQPRVLLFVRHFG
ncbi:MAG: hypothetical protein H6822_15095 [Planctomycetaceae bacterium]|nr:hypothetical protein [Planctomycetales bacterium]MCB9923507.1 hypothetical protein [Planctomycetaceae bacterium]